MNTNTAAATGSKASNVRSRPPGSDTAARPSQAPMSRPPQGPSRMPSEPFEVRAAAAGPDGGAVSARALRTR